MINFSYGVGLRQSNNILIEKDEIYDLELLLGDFDHFKFLAYF